MVDPRLIERALVQTVEQGSEYAVVPLHSYEAWALSPGSEFLGKWHRAREYCFKLDSEWDDEVILICLKPRHHEDEHGKPGHRQLGHAPVECGHA